MAAFANPLKVRVPELFPEHLILEPLYESETVPGLIPHLVGQKLPLQYS
jgi:hypothetical protein